MIEQVFVWLAFWLFHITWLSVIPGLVSVLAGSSPRRPVASYRLHLVCLLGLIPMMLIAGILANRSASTIASASRPLSNRFAQSTQQSSADFVDSVSNVNGLQTEPVVAAANEAKMPDERNTKPAIQSTVTPFTLPAPENSVSAVSEMAANDQSLASKLTFWVPLGYLAGLLVMLMRLTRAAIGAQRIRSSVSSTCNSTLALLAEEVAAKVGLFATPVVRIGTRYSVPMLIGLFRPMILLPESLLGIPAEELRTILMHEMAHLYRRDHWALALQRILETVLFFHPTIWFVSRRLNLLRELCCDDMVLATGTKPIGYASSLYRVAANSHRNNSWAVAATGTCKNQLVFRVGRILGEPPLSNTTKIIGRRLLLLTCLLAALFAAGIYFTGGSSESEIAATTDNQQANSNNSDDTKFVYPQIAGTVLDALGNPIPGATVVLQEHPYKYPTTTRPDGSQRIRDDLVVIGTTRTGADGKFQLESVAVPDFTSYLDSKYPVTLVVFDEEHAVSWRELKYIPKRPIEIQLRETNRVTVDIVSDASSGPLHAKLVGLMTKSDWKKKRIENRPPSETIYTGLVNLPESGIGNQILKLKNSKLQIDLPKNKIAAIRISGSRVVPKTVYLSNINSTLPSQANNTLIKDGGKVVVRNGTERQFMIVDDKGQPVVGATVTAIHNNPGQALFRPSLQTDVSGVVTFENLDSTKLVEITVDTVDKSLLTQRVNGKALAGKNSIFKIQLEAGRTVTGRVVEAETNEGIAGVTVGFSPKDPKSLGVIDELHRSFGRPAISEADGRFTMTVPDVAGSIQVSRSKNLLKHYRDMEQRFEINTARDTVIKLKRLKKFVMRVQVLDETGEPAPNVRLSFIASLNRGGSHSSMWPPSETTDGNGIAELEMRSPLFAGAMHIGVVAIDRRNSKAGNFVWERPFVWWREQQPKDLREEAFRFADLIKETYGDGDIIIPAKIKLQPMATITGQLVDGISGEPIPYATSELYQNLNPGFSTSGNYFETIETDREGKFETLAMPGMQGYFRFQHPEYIQSNNIMPEDYVIANAGETLYRDFSLFPSGDLSADLKFEAPDIGDRKGMEAIEFLQNKFVADRKQFNQRIAGNYDRKTDFIIRQLNPTQAYQQAMLKIADTNKGTAVEARALAWVCQALLHTSMDLKQAYRLRSQVGDRLLNDHVDSKWIESCLASLIASASEESVGSVKKRIAAAEKIVANNPHHSIQGKALLQMTGVYNRQVMRLKGTQDKSDVTEIKEKIRDIYERIKNEYADVEYSSKETLGQRAEKALLAKEKLRIGQPAIEITGKNLNGQPMKLTDFRGKIVVLDFWGSWCGPCISELPDLVKLAQKYPNQVQIVGVMADSLKDAKECVIEENVPWPNWYERSNGPIHKQWNIEGWPTIFVINTDGKIAGKYLRDLEILECVEKLIAKNKLKTF